MVAKDSEKLVDKKKITFALHTPHDIIRLLSCYTDVLFVSNWKRDNQTYVRWTTL